MSDIGLVRELIALQAPTRASSLEERRRQYEHAERAFAAQISPVEAIDADGLRAEWVISQRDPTQPVIVYLHGGGYSLGSSRSHRHLAAAIGRAASAAVLSVDYRRAPEHPFPAAVEDALAAARWTLGHTRAPIVLTGDSAGGGLVLASMLELREDGPRLPAAGVCLSPWVDLTCTAGSHTALAERDPMLSHTELRRMAAAYLRDADPSNPLASPVFARLRGLPPLLIQVGTEEILLDDARILAEKACAEGVDVTFQVWPEMIHTWQWFYPVLDEGRRAIEAIAAFARHHTQDTESVPRANVTRRDYKPSTRRAPPENSRIDPRERMGSDLTGFRISTAERPSADTKRPSADTERPSVPASLIQEAHLQIVPWTAGRGYLSWAYQLNGRLDVQALQNAIDDVVRRHEILRVKFERREGRLYQAPTPFTPGTLAIVDLTDHAKPQGLDTAIRDARRTYDSLSPLVDPRFRATLYVIDAKTSVLAMFVAETIVDSDSGTLLTAAIVRAYAHHTGTSVAEGLPQVSEDSYLDYVLANPPDPAAITRAREHWTLQASCAPAHPALPVALPGSSRHSSTVTFAMVSAEWAEVLSRARELHTTPYILILTRLQLALARVAGIDHFLAHTIVPQRTEATRGMIGNFHSLARIEMRNDPDASFKTAVVHTAAAVAQAIEHSVLPASLAFHVTPTALRKDPLPGIRVYMFTNHQGPVFAGVRRRRFRLHEPAPAPLTVSCVHAPDGRQRFVFSSVNSTEVFLRRLASALRDRADESL